MAAGGQKPQLEVHEEVIFVLLSPLSFLLKCAAEFIEALMRRELLVNNLRQDQGDNHCCNFRVNHNEPFSKTTSFKYAFICVAVHLNGVFLISPVKLIFKIPIKIVGKLNN